MVEGPSSSLVGRLCDALDAASERFVALLRRGPDPTAPAIGTWTVGETAAHVSRSPTYFLSVARGEVTDPHALDDVARTNAEHLAADPERDPQVLADRLEPAHEAFVSFVRTVDGDPLVRPFGGVEVPLSSVLTVELAELLVHGDDIARAVRIGWPIPRDEAAITLDGLLPLLPFVVDEERARTVEMRCELRVRGGDRALLVLEGGRLRVERPSAAPVDCRMSVDPAAFLLLAYRRIGMLGPIVRGRIVAWGRRPWRAASLQTVLKPI